MNTRPPGAGRVVVAFDPYQPDRAALRLAQQLASAASQSLHALYVEETEALTLGSFPWAREVMSATAETRPLQREAIERGLSGRAAEARSIFESAVAGFADATFERVRGRLAEELKRIAVDAAGVLMDWPPASRRSRTWAGTVVRTLLESPAPIVGLVDPRGRPTSSIVVVADRPDATPALELAARLAAPAHARITMLARRATAAAIVERARAELADTVLVQRGEMTGGESVLAELAFLWSGSLWLLREPRR